MNFPRLGVLLVVQRYIKRLVVNLNNKKTYILAFEIKKSSKDVIVLESRKAIFFYQPRVLRLSLHKTTLQRMEWMESAAQLKDLPLKWQKGRGG